MKYDEQIAVDGMREGQSWAYEMIVSRYWNRMMQFVMGYIYNSGEAKIIATHTFEDAFMKIGQYASTNKFSTWLFRIGRNNCIDYLRSQPTFIPADERWPSTQPNPEERLIALESRDIIRNAISKLKPKIKVYVEDIYINGLSFKEIAEKYNINQSTLRVRVMRGRDKMCNQLKQLR